MKHYEKSRFVFSSCHQFVKKGLSASI